MFEDRKHASIQFHKMKGGAGFFGLSAIAEIAGLLEDGLSGDAATDQITTWLGALEEAVTEMPKPQS